MFAFKLRSLHILNHVLVLSLGLNFFWYQYILIWLWWYVIAVIGVSMGFHMMLAHNSFKTNKLFKNIMLFLGSIATGGTPLQWASIHRQHHIYEDTDKDPHSPHHIGYLRTYFSLWNRTFIDRRTVVPFLKDKDVMFFHKNYFNIISLWIAFLFIIGGIDLVVAMYCFPAVIALHAYGAINTIGHSEEGDDHGKNSIFLNILVPSEGNHKEHHQYPTKQHFPRNIIVRAIEK